MNVNGAAATKDDRLPALIADRDRYRQWLEALEAKRPDIPDHIYARISADYEARLERTLEELGAHVDALESRLDERREALEKLEAELTTKQDELLEAEVRHRIGEYDDRRWNSLERQLTKAIQELEARRAELESEVERLDDTLHQIRETTSPDVDPPVPALSAAEERSAFLKALAEASGSIELADEVAAPESAAPSGRAVGDRDGATSAVQEIARPVRRGSPLRTLRCETCGSFNLPEALFCEACGGDLPES